MKANGAPEKIYLDIEPNLDDCTWHLTNPNGDSVEYTRTDAFIEKACEFLNKVTQGYAIHELLTGENYEDKIVEDFKNYMKGE